jgi:hypothetical protein
VKACKSFALLLGLALVASSVVVAQDERSKGTQQPDRPISRAKLVKPWSDLRTLSDDQKHQIVQIHATALDEMRRVREKEQTDIMALMTDENKAELAELKAKERADAKARRTAGKDGDPANQGEKK